MDLVVIGLQGLIYMVLMFLFLWLYRTVRKQRVNIREMVVQAILGGAIFMGLLFLLGS
jgi:uncharacterized BrkB/YihY/UPF0761 family membrane protein